MKNEEEKMFLRSGEHFFLKSKFIGGVKKLLGKKNVETKIVGGKNYRLDIVQCIS